MDKFLNAIIDLFLKNNYEPLIWLLLLALFVFLFREFRKSKLNLDNLNSIRVDNALEKYSIALATLKKYENKLLGIELVIDNLYTLYPYTNEEVMREINDFSEESNISELKSLLEKEALRIKSLQHDSVSFRFSNKAIDVIPYTLEKYKVASLIGPIGLSAITTFFIIALIGLLGYLVNPTSLVDKIIASIFLISSFVNTLMFLVTIDLLAQPKYKHKILNYIGLIMFYINTLMLCINPSTGVQIYYIIYTLFYTLLIIIEVFSFKKIIDYCKDKFKNGNNILKILKR